MLGLRVGHPRLFSRPGKDGMAGPPGQVRHDGRGSHASRPAV